LHQRRTGGEVLELLSMLLLRRVLTGVTVAKLFDAV
jgi:hypothetical protein